MPRGLSPSPMTHWYFKLSSLCVCLYGLKIHPEKRGRLESKLLVQKHTVWSPFHYPKMHTRLYCCIKMGFVLKNHHKYIHWYISALLFIVCPLPHNSPMQDEFRTQSAMNLSMSWGPTTMMVLNLCAWIFHLNNKKEGRHPAYRQTCFWVS